MNCPECNRDKITIIHTDPIPCNDCKSTVKIDYCLCRSCDYTFRANNGKPMDGELINYELMDEAFEDIFTALDAEMAEEDAIKMSDLLYNCVSCNDPSAYRTDEFCYACPACGYEWEILRHE